MKAFLFLSLLFTNLALGQTTGKPIEGNYCQGVQCESNLVKNPSAEKNTLNVTTSSATATRVKSGDVHDNFIINGKGSWVIDASALNGYVQFDLINATGDQSSGNCAFVGSFNGDASLYSAQVLDASNNVILSQQLTNTIDAWKEFKLNVSCATAGQRKVRLTQTLAGTAPAFYAGRITYGKTKIAMGTIQTDPVAFTPTGSITTNATYTGTWAQFGKYLEQETTITFTGANTQSFVTINLPPGLNIDTSSKGISVTSLATDISLSGKFTGTGHFNLRALTNGTTNSFNVFFMNVDTTASNAFNPDKYNGVNPSSNLPEVIASGTKIYIKIRVPIDGWTSGARKSDGYDAQEIVAKYTSSSAAAIPNSATVFNFGTKIKDDLNLVTTGAAWKFTAPSTRYCNVTVRIDYSGSASASRLDVTIRKNGAGQDTLFKTTSGAVVETAVFPFGLDVVKGDTLDVTVHETVDGGSFTSTQQIDISCETGTAHITPEGRNVTSKAINSGIESAYVTCNAGSTIHSNPGSWLASISNIASGACTVTFTSGRFSSAPHCFTQYVDTSTGYLVQTKIHSASASSIVLLGAQQAGGTTSVPPGYSLYLFCKGTN